MISWDLSLAFETAASSTVPSAATSRGATSPRTYLVTGAGSGIGRATQKRLEAAGARVVGVDLHGADIVADLSSADGRAALLDVAGPLDAVIACAGLSPSGASPETARRIDHASPAQILRVNFFGAVATLEGLRPLLARSAAPRAALVASTAVLKGDNELVELCLSGDETAAVAFAASPGPEALREQQRTDPWNYARWVYASSKRAIARWMRQVAPKPEWAGAGIPLNGIAPGLMLTPMAQPLLDDPAIRRQIQSGLPMPLHGPADPSAPAALLAWLTSEENVVTTGQLIFIDGGADAVIRGDGIW